MSPLGMLGHIHRSFCPAGESGPGTLGPPLRSTGRAGLDPKPQQRGLAVDCPSEFPLGVLTVVGSHLHGWLEEEMDACASQPLWQGWGEDFPPPHLHSAPLRIFAPSTRMVLLSHKQSFQGGTGVTKAVARGLQGTWQVYRVMINCWGSPTGSWV